MPHCWKSHDAAHIKKTVPAIYIDNDSISTLNCQIDSVKLCFLDKPRVDGIAVLKIKVCFAVRHKIKEDINILTLRFYHGYSELTASYHRD